MDIYRTIVTSLVFLVLIILLDLYSWQALKAIIENPDSLRIAKRIHFGFSGCIIVILLLFIFFPQFSQYKSFKTYFYAIVVGIYMSKLLVVFFLIIDDFIRLVRWVFQKVFYSYSGSEIGGGEDLGRLAFLSQLGIILGGGLFALLTKGMIKGVYDYRVHSSKLKLKNLPEAFRGLKILQISDIHSGSWQNEHKVHQGIEMIKQQHADVIFFTGDLVNNSSDELVPWMQLLGEIKAPMGVYSILGNHDYGDYVTWDSPEQKSQNLDKLKAAHQKLGWKLMLNEHSYLQRGDSKIGLIGVENWGHGKRWPKYGKLSEAKQGMDEVPVKILLSHDPSHWEAQVLTEHPDIDLMLAGHTHGMQFGVEWGNFRWSPSSWAYKQWADLYQEREQYLYVNRGFGFLGYPGRVGILPEITVIELV
ncbi:MAG: metallophosphoesterase [Bacteroidetes bacterium]|nr:metallophosphoesterase [Bacteroidota bacterium]